MGIRFPNPVGPRRRHGQERASTSTPLAALGFGSLEVGTVTPRPQPGNPKPRLFRLVEHEAIINRMGFNNVGVEKLLRNVEKSSFRGVLGINIGKNLDTPIERAADDYLACLDAVYDRATYVAVNISSPNTKNLRDLQSRRTAGRAARGHHGAARRARRARRRREAARGEDRARTWTTSRSRPSRSCPLKHRIDGLIATNTTIGRARRRGPPPRGRGGRAVGPPGVRALDGSAAQARPAPRGPHPAHRRGRHPHAARTRRRRSTPARASCRSTPASSSAARTSSPRRAAPSRAEARPARPRDRESASRANRRKASAASRWTRPRSPSSRAKATRFASPQAPARASAPGRGLRAPRARTSSPTAEAWEAELVVKVKEIQPGEWNSLAPGSTLFSFQHLVGRAGARASTSPTAAITAIAFEMVRDADGGFPAARADVGDRRAPRDPGGRASPHAAGRRQRHAARGLPGHGPGARARAGRRARGRERGRRWPRRMGAQVTVAHALGSHARRRRAPRLGAVGRRATSPRRRTSSADAPARRPRRGRRVRPGRAHAQAPAARARRAHEAAAPSSWTSPSTRAAWPRPRGPRRTPTPSSSRRAWCTTACPTCPRRWRAPAPRRCRPRSLPYARALAGKGIARRAARGRGPARRRAALARPLRPTQASRRRPACPSRRSAPADLGHDARSPRGAASTRSSRRRSARSAATPAAAPTPRRSRAARPDLDQCPPGGDEGVAPLARILGAP